MKILYLGSKGGTSSQRAHALLRLGHEVQLLDPSKFVSEDPSGRSVATISGCCGAGV